ncbi:9383_t:CDS:10 [Ambispora gerdemannii]|uniref:9383_t:CDS:1 n=1 Tax=Ambispora gerdemannii TaxID=144530 RepID=A0A9N9FYF8_9GLOM|nr:9383_t:CDS:10 [Ambispora gerdemannii]
MSQIHSGKQTSIQESFISAARNILRSNSTTLWDCGSKLDTHENLIHAIDALLAINVTNVCLNEQECLELLILGCSQQQPLFIVNLRITENDTNFCNIILGSYTSSKVDILRALSKVLYENGNQCEKFHDRLLNMLILLAQPNNPQLEIRRMAINCLGNLSARTGNKLHGKYRSIYDVLFANLNAAEDKSLLKEPFGTAIETIRIYVFFKIGEMTTLSIDRTPRNQITRSYASTSSSRTSQARNPREKSTYHHRSSNHSWLSSDSELSDSDYNQNKRNDDSRVRLNALGCLQSIARASPKLLYPYWNKFLPDARTLSTSPSLFTIISCDPIQTVRVAACSSITTLIDRSKQYLSLADDRELKSSFTSLSANLGAIVRQLHHELINALREEQQTIMLLQLLKCCNVLVNNAAYDRLSGGYLTRLFNAVLPLLFIKECKSNTDEIAFLFQEQLIEISKSELKISPIAEGNSRVNLLMYLIALINDSQQPSTLRIEAWGVLCVCTHLHFLIIRSQWTQLNNLISADLQNEDLNIRAAAMKFLEEYAKAAAAHSNPTNQNNNENDETIDHSKNTDTIPASELLPWWMSTLDHYIQKSSLDTCHAVRALTCDCLSHISSIIFSEMPTDRAMYSITLLLRMVQDESPNVRASACRTLGVFILFPCLSEDTIFATDMALSIIQNISDATLLVRIRSSWALGNLCDSLVTLSEVGENKEISSSVLDFLTVDMFNRIIVAALAASVDNDKVRVNAVRALGSLMRISPERYLLKEQTGLVKDVVLALTKNFDHGSLKARWNACYAAANMLRNQDFPIGINDWTTSLYDSLSKVVRSAKNFKVRINACLALSMPNSREKFGNVGMFSRIFEVIVVALENADNMNETGFEEYKYQENLKSQLLETYEHLKNLATDDDK